MAHEHNLATIAGLSVVGLGSGKSEQKFGSIVSIRGVVTGIAGRTNARRTIQFVDLDPGIIGDRR